MLRHHSGTSVASHPSVHTWNAIISGHTKKGNSEIALDSYCNMLCRNDTEVDKVTLLCVVKSCSSMRALQEGHLVHAQILEIGLEKDLFLGNALIDMYAKCRSFHDAHSVLDQAPRRDVVSWGAIISGYTHHGQGLPALSILQRVYDDGIEPNRVIFLSILKACACIGNLHLAYLVHQLTIEKALDLDVTIGNTLIDMYVKLESLGDALKVFNCLPCRTMVSWGAVISGYAKHGHGHMSLKLFDEMQEKGVQVNTMIVSCILRTCGAVGALDQGEQIHKKFFTGKDRDCAVGNALIHMYTICGCIDKALEVFYVMVKRDEASYNTMVAGCIHCGKVLLAFELLGNMHQEGIPAQRSTLLQSVEACSTLAYGRSVHYYAVLFELDSDLLIGSALVVMYSKQDSVDEAHEVFSSLPSRDLVAWGAIIAVYAEHGRGRTALELIDKMREEDVKPSVPIFLSALKACASLADTKEGRKFHDEIIKSGFELDSNLGSSLIDMYAKCGSLVEAHIVFKGLHVRDLVSWSSLISGYAHHGCGGCAIELFEGVLQEGFEPDKGMILSLLKACSSSSRDIDQCRLVHFLASCCALEIDVIVGSAILDFYAKCDSIEDANKIFCLLPKCHSAPWNAMMAGYFHCSDSVSALQLLQEMQEEKIELDKVMVLSLLKASGNMGATKLGRLVHDLIVRSRLESDIVFGNALVDMHAKCGGIEEAMIVFSFLQFKDIVSWGAVIAALAQQGLFERANNCARQMQAAGLKLTKAIFTNILSACSHGGVFEEGYTCLKVMEEDYAVIPDIEHYSGMVDLLSRTGQLDTAEALLQSMPMLPDLLGWTSFLTSCKTYGHVGMGRLCFDHVSELNPDDAAGHVLMSHVYGDADLWEDVENVKEMRRKAALSKKPGKAWIEVDGKLQEFIVGNVHQIHACDGGLRSRRLLKSLKELGYVPQIGSVFETLAKDGEKGISLGSDENKLLHLRRFGPYIYSKGTHIGASFKSSNFLHLVVCSIKQHPILEIFVCNVYDTFDLATTKMSLVSHFNSLHINKTFYVGKTL